MNPSLQNKTLPSGIELLRQLSEGTVKKVPNEYVLRVKASVSEACDELIELGARIRPLVVDGQKIGWVRGLHTTERRRLSRWVHEPNDYISSVLNLATSLKNEEIENFSALEIRNMIELIQKMTEYDISLYPYLSAYTGTMSSENLWHGYGTQLTSFENRRIEMPDGGEMRILAPSEHARLWATLCVYREQAKARLDSNWNAVLQVRPLAGKSVEPLAKELKTLGQSLATDSLDPWENIVKYKADRDLDDGWAHPENLETPEGMLKELHGSMNFDKHEQTMADIEKRLLAAAEARNAAIAAAHPNRGLGINEETLTIHTEEDIRNIERNLKKGKISPKPFVSERGEVTRKPVDMLKKYM